MIAWIELVFVAGLFAAPVLMWNRSYSDREGRLRPMVAWWMAVMAGTIVCLAIAAAHAADQRSVMVPAAVSVGLAAVAAATVGVTAAVAAIWRRFGGRRGSRATR